MNDVMSFIVSFSCKFYGIKSRENKNQDNKSEEKQSVKLADKLTIDDIMG